METLAVGILGLAHLHARGYLPHFAALEGMGVVAVAEANPAVREAFLADYPVRGYADWRQMLRRERLDLALLLLPHADCPQAAAACARRSIHLLVEKPMAARSAGIRRIERAAAQAGVVLATPYLWRYHPVARQIKALVQQGALGEIVGGDARYGAGRTHRYPEAGAGWMLEKARSGGGPMHNLGVHWIDLYRWLLEDEVVEAMGKCLRVGEGYDVEDNCFALLTFSRGAVLGLDVSYSVPDGYPAGRDLYISLRGTRGVVSWSPAFEGVEEELLICADGTGGSCQRIRFELPPVAGYSGAAGLEFLGDLEQAIRRGRPPTITGEDGRRALQVVEAIYRSAATGRAVKVAV